MKPHTHRIRSRRRGVEIVEFALILPIILAVLMAIVEGGWMIKNQLTLANATRDGARFAALGGTSSATIDRIKNGAAGLSPQVRTDQIFLERQPKDTTTPQVFTAWPLELPGATKNAVEVGNVVRVRIVYQNPSLTGFFSYMRNRPLNTSVTMLREAN